jgi:alkylation response protein AidB-like acyl-CoA dehydrogenase
MSFDPDPAPDSSETPLVPTVEHNASANGGLTPQLEDFRDRVATVIREEILPLVDEAERSRVFPRKAIEVLGEHRLLSERWAGAVPGAPAKSVILAEELGRGGVGGIGVGVSLHLEAVTAILLRFGRSETARAWTKRALDGSAIGCLATSEQEVGSDLSSVETTATRISGGWQLKGRKWFVSPGAEADFALILCKAGGLDRPEAAERRPGARLVIALVPRAAFTAEKRLQTLGMRDLGTARIAIDATIDDDALIGPPGLGLAVASAGLVHERLSIAAQLMGAASRRLASRRRGCSGASSSGNACSSTRPYVCGSPIWRPRSKRCGSPSTPRPSVATQPLAPQGKVPA